MMLWVDDIRPAPRGWKLAQNYAEAVAELSSGKVSIISLDHDLGADKSGYDIAVWIERREALDSEFVVPKILCHSANPVGRRRIEAAIAAIDRLKRG